MPPSTLLDDRELHANSSHRRASHCSLHFHSASDSLLSRLTTDDTREIRYQTGNFMSGFAPKSRHGDSPTVLCVYLEIQCELGLPMVRAGLIAQLQPSLSSSQPEAERTRTATLTHHYSCSRTPTGPRINYSDGPWVLSSLTSSLTPTLGRCCSEPSPEPAHARRVSETQSYGPYGTISHSAHLSDGAELTFTGVAHFPLTFTAPPPP